MKQILKVLAISAASVGLLIACNKKSDGGAGTQPQPVPVNNCVTGQPQANGYTCVNGQLVAPQAGYGNLLNNVQFQEYGSYFTGSIGISGTANTTVIDPNDTRAFTRYYGQVTYTGSLTMNTAVPGCNIPAGVYNIQGTGNFNGGAWITADLILQGPVTLQWQITNALIYSDGGSPELNGSANRLQVYFSNMTMQGAVSCGNAQTK